MPTLFNKLEPEALASFIASNTALNDSQIVELNKDRVDLSSFTTAQIAEYRASEGFKTKTKAELLVAKKPEPAKFAPHPLVQQPNKNGKHKKR